MVWMLRAMMSMAMACNFVPVVNKVTIPNRTSLSPHREVQGGEFKVRGGEFKVHGGEFKVSCMRIQGLVHVNSRSRAYELKGSCMRIQGPGRRNSRSGAAEFKVRGGGIQDPRRRIQGLVHAYSRARACEFKVSCI
eukprot:1171558-Prorocentrum_minimum.AAC.1